MHPPESIPDPSGVPQPAALQLELAGALDRVRPAAEAVRRFLQEQGCGRSEVLDCELALVEACNNAIQYAAPTASQQPVRVEVLCLPHEIELRITDHASGFEWPEGAALPDPESERGRGVYLIQTLMNETRYWRQPQGNTLILRKRRAMEHIPAAPPSPPHPGPLPLGGGEGGSPADPGAGGSSPSPPPRGSGPG